MPGPYRCIRLTARARKNRLYRLPPKKDCHVFIARQYVSLRIRPTDASQLKNETSKRKKIKERKERAKEADKRDRKGKERKDKKSK